jgi:hypothetical protein
VGPVGIFVKSYREKSFSDRRSILSSKANITIVGSAGPDGRSEQTRRIVRHVLAAPTAASDSTLTLVFTVGI